MDKNLDEVKGIVQKKFNEIRAALHMREKLLLRQLEVIANTRQQQQLLKKSTNAVDNSDAKREHSGVSFIPGEGEDAEEQLLTAIRSYGHFLLDNSDMQLALQDYRTTGLRNEDYIEPLDDHETMYKCLQDGNVSYLDLDEDGAPPEAIVVDFSRNRSLVEDNAKRSIINITLQEAKDLIKKAKIKRETYVPPLNLEELDDELESSIAEAVSSLGRETSIKSKSSVQEPPKTKSRKQRFKPKITINNCNGTINLRNIASLTINCASEEAVSAEIPLAKSADSSTTEPSNSTPTTTASSSNYSSNASSRSQSKKQKANKKQERIEREPSSDSTPTPGHQGKRYEETEIHDVTCDFYNRLLNEIKKSMVEKPRRSYHQMTEPVQAAAADSSCDANSNPRQSSAAKQEPVSTTTSLTQSESGPQLQPGKRLILKNFENLKIILEANSGDEDSFHPVQIEQWLAEIISEADLEPMQNTDILEHSRIHSSESP
ncbi:uncharacterized protein LOC108146869 [Drosophila elegans]|uniref:uncharacterized protein LOC108146869 n=1 Tax=Drosophila elegans TaxID=30023 RepID=UPI0007E7E830|nr:uncharacterized protein LOC108146869 [Drosophila elegans]